MPKVSVIVPVYNTEKYIIKCLNSLKNQTLRDIEVLIINDGTKDNSVNLINDFIKLDNRFKLINKNNGGLSSARNEGLKYVTSKWVSFIDSDDWVENNMLEVLFEIAEKSDSDMAVCGCRDIFKDKQIVTSTNMKDEVIYINNAVDFFLSDKRQDIAIVVWNKIYKTEIINKYNIKFEPNNEVFSEDILFNLEYQLFCEKIASTKKVLYNYLIRDNSIMNSKIDNLIGKFYNLILKFKLFCEINNKEFVAKRILPKIATQLTSIAIINAANCHINNEIIKNLIYIRKSEYLLELLNNALKLREVSFKDKVKIYIYIKLKLEFSYKLIKFMARKD
ncbi:glycosyltransferase [Clostridium perfringens]